MVVHPDSQICKPLLEIFHYMADNYKEILPEALNYLRIMYNVYIREDSFAGSRKSGNFNVICDACCNDMNAADLLDRNRTKLKKYMNELQDAYQEIQASDISSRQKISYYNDHYDKAVSGMHECKIHMLIVKSSGVHRHNPVFLTWKRLFKLAKQNVEDMGTYHEEEGRMYQETVCKNEVDKTCGYGGNNDSSTGGKNLTFADFKPEAGADTCDL